MSRPKISIDKFRETWLRTNNIGESLIAAGGSPKSAERGYAALNKKCKLIVDGKEASQPSDDEIKGLLEKLKTVEDISEYAREKIIRAIELGESPKNLEGHLKLLGNLKEHNIFDTKKSNEIFVMAPPESVFDDLDDWDTKSLLDGNGQLVLTPVTGEKGLYVDSMGNTFAVKYSPQMNGKSA